VVYKVGNKLGVTAFYIIY